MLNIGNVVIEKNRNSCSFVVQSFSELKDVFWLRLLRHPYIYKFSIRPQIYIFGVRGGGGGRRIKNKIYFIFPSKRLDF